MHYAISRRLQQFLYAVVGVLLCAAVVSTATFDDLVQMKGRASLACVMFSVCAAIGATAVRTFRISVLLSGRPHIVSLFGGMAGVCFAGAVIPSDAALYWMLRKTGGISTPADFARPWLVLRGLDTVFLLCILALAISYWPAVATVNVQWQGPVAVLALVAVVTVGLMIWGGQYCGAIGRAIKLAAIPNCAKMGKNLFLSFWLATAYWAFLVASMALALLAFSSEGPLDRLIFAAMIAVGVGSLPVHPPLAIGTAEAVWIFSLTTTGAPVGDAVAIAIGVRLVSVATLLVHGACGLAALRSMTT